MQVITRAMVRTISSVRLIGDEANEIVSTAIALDKAEAEGLDLVIVSDKSSPPVARIQDFKKIQYEQKKAKAKQTKHRQDLKEIQLKANITDHDLQTKVNSAIKFLERGDKVKVTVRLKGRERDLPERAHQLLDKMIASLPMAKVSKVPGPIATALFEPSK